MLPPSPFPWEDVSRRQDLPASLDQIASRRGGILVVPRSIMEKIQTTHPADVAGLDRLGEVLDRWELVGLSPSSPGRLELYARLDGIWHTAVIALANDTTPFCVLVTFHRIYER